jgi:hypothetical protein
MAKTKMRKFADGGLSSAQEEWLGGADRTDPYILARMRSAVPDQSGPSESTIEDESGRGNISPNAAAFNKGTGNEPSVPVTKTVTKVAVTKPQTDWENNKKMLPGEEKPKPETPAEYKARMEGLQSKDALINVSPEDYVTPGGFLKGMLKKVISNSAKNALKTYTAREMADMAPKMIGRESLKLGREPLKLGMKRGGSVKKMASGGTVSSASKRADGIATKGKTRGKMC